MTGNTTLQLQRQITQLRRVRAELSARLLVHALADEETAAVGIYRRLVEIDGEITALRWRILDILDARHLAEQGAAAVAAVERMLER